MNGLCQKINPYPIHQCKIHQILVNGQCLDTVVIGKICQMDAQCTGGAKCLNKFCSCPEGTVQNEQMFRIYFH